MKVDYTIFVDLFPQELDEQVSKLHLPPHSAVRTVLSQEQAVYIGDALKHLQRWAVQLLSCKVQFRVLSNAACLAVDVLRPQTSVVVVTFRALDYMVYQLKHDRVHGRSTHRCESWFLNVERLWTYPRLLPKANCTFRHSIRS